MRTVTHRELRDRSDEVLQAVAAGETVQVTNDGRIAALIVPPPPADPIGVSIGDLIERGRARAAVATRRFSGITRTRIEETTAEVLDDLRHPW